MQQYRLWGLVRLIVCVMRIFTFSERIQTLKFQGLDYRVKIINIQTDYLNV